MSARDLTRFAERDGWSASVTRGGHIRLDHPEATMPIFAASTPSDHRALANAIAMMRRALPPREPKPPAVEHRRLPKKKRAPKPRQTEADAEIDIQTPLSPTDGAPRPKAEPARRTEAAHLEVAMIEEYGLPRCPGCWQPEHLCVCYVAACPVCGDEGRLLGPLEDRKTEELCDACAGGVRFDRRRPSASA